MLCEGIYGNVALREFECLQVATSGTNFGQPIPLQLVHVSSLPACPTALPQPALVVDETFEEEGEFETDPSRLLNADDLRGDALLSVSSPCVLRQGL